MLSANPIGIIILLIAGLVAGLIYAYRHSKTFRDVVQAAMKGVVIAFHWVINVAKAVWDWLKSHWRLIAGIIIGPVGAAVIWVLRHWSAIKAAFRAGVTWVQNVFRVAWAALKQIFTHPIETAITGIRVLLGKAGLLRIFSDAVAKVGQIWDGLKAKAKAPIRFVIVTVLNNGLIAAFNKTAKFVALPSIPDIPLPKGFSKGGYTPARWHRPRGRARHQVTLAVGQSVRYPVV